VDNADGVTAAGNAADENAADGDGATAGGGITGSGITGSGVADAADPGAAVPGTPASDAAGAGTPAADPSVPDAGPTPPPAKVKKKKLGRELGIIVVAALALTLVLKIFVVQVYEIPSASMENTLLIGDRVLVNKLVYHFRNIHRGDIIVFSGAGSWGDLNGNPIPPPSSNPLVRAWDDVLSGVGLRSGTTYYIKRVIGLPGDHVACCTDGDVTVNGVKLDETSYLYPGAAPSSLQFSVTVPAGRLWVMGDNRAFSDDSRYHQTTSPGDGTIPENEVAGRAFLIIWPFSQFRDLPIPATFQQAAFNAGPAGLAGGGVVALGVPLVFWRHRRRRLS
jgi:signal peptidase I